MYNGDSYSNESEMTYWGDRDETDGYYDEEILRYGDLDGQDGKKLTQTQN